MFGERIIKPRSTEELNAEMDQQFEQEDQQKNEEISKLKDKLERLQSASDASSTSEEVIQITSDIIKLLKNKRYALTLRISTRFIDTMENRDEKAITDIKEKSAQITEVIEGLQSGDIGKRVMAESDNAKVNTLDEKIRSVRKDASTNQGEEDDNQYFLNTLLSEYKQITGKDWIDSTPPEAKSIEEQKEKLTELIIEERKVVGATSGKDYDEAKDILTGYLDQYRQLAEENFIFESDQPKDEETRLTNLKEELLKIKTEIIKAKENEYHRAFYEFHEDLKRAQSEYHDITGEDFVFADETENPTPTTIEELER